MSFIKLPVVTGPSDTSSRRSATEVLGVEDAGSSVAGSTFWKTMRRCPREHALRNLARWRKVGGASEALTVGWTFHHALEHYYRARHAGAVEPERAAWDAIRALSGEPGYEETYAEVERLLAHYLETYRHADAGWRVVAVEETLEHLGADFRYSARLDLVVHDTATDRLWIVEHKTARAITADLLSGYQQDMQILGQVWLFHRLVDTGSYPMLGGVIVNITTKAKQPRCERVTVYPSREHLAAFEESMQAAVALEGVYRALGWPKALGNCTGPMRYFSTCDYFDVCHARPLASVAELSREEPPFGFERHDNDQHEDE